ncbi:MAG: hypothetical protein LUF92_04900, partial [Clostridiales bacterium]|nr:hypothetical protein [Clostridiales bacterium]
MESNMDVNANKRERKKLSLKDFGMERILLIAVAGVILLATNFSFGEKDDGEEEDTTENTELISENEAYI